jgi:transcriptional regulator of NAD metabolism
MSEGKRILGEKRREFLLSLLKTSSNPITGSELAKKANVSRQVIVNDMTLLKAKNEPIIATSQGYLYMLQPGVQQSFEKTIACCHSPLEVENELFLLVDNGVTVKDVRIEHPVYGDLTASIMVSNRKEVIQFLEKIKNTSAAYLSELTEGVHLHTVSAANAQSIADAEQALEEAGYLVDENN